MTAPPTDARDDAVTVVRTLRAAGHVAYFAGGCVRDTLLGRPPKDYDVATDAPPDRVRQLFRNTQAVGAAFGVVLVRVRRTPIEVATFRTDGTYTDGRRPDAVRFATAEEDARRRDFTINGLFMDPDTERVIDHVGGWDDLDAKVIRAIGNPDERFAEDHLRMLRAVRFAARLGFTIEPATADAIRRHAAELPRISEERVGDELRRMLAGVGGGAITATSYLHHLELMQHLFRFFPVGDRGPLRLADSQQRGRWNSPFAMDEFNFTGLTHARSFGTALATVGLYWRWYQAGRPDEFGPLLTRPAVADVVRGFRLALRISNDEAAEVEGTLLGAASMLVEPEPTLAAQKRLLGRPTGRDSVWLLCGIVRADLYGGRLTSLVQSLIDRSHDYVAPPPLVTGDDLTAAGATPGPAFKRALDAAYDAQLEGRVADKPAALAVAVSLL